MVATLYGIAILALTISNLYKLLLVWRYFRYRSKVPVRPPMPAELPRVTVQLPIYNELFVIERLIRAAVALEYPRHRKEIQILDDSTDDTTALVARLVSELSAEGFDIKHLRRNDRREFKAGALAEGLKTATGELVAIFDADFVPPPSFLLDCVPYLAREQVGMVQAKWSFLNERTSLLTRVQAIFLNGHFVLEHSARFRSGHFFNFNGTAGIWRKRTIVDAGGWSGDTLTEDLDLSYRAQLKGWKFVYLKHVEVPSELPGDLESLKAQQFRWVKGMVQVMRKLLVPVWRSSFSLGTKVDATFHFLSCSGYVTTTLAAICVVPYFIHWKAPGQEPWLWYAIFSVLLNTMGVLVYYAVAEIENRSLGWRRAGDLLLLIPVGVGLSLNGMRAVLSGLWGNASPFERTPKFGAVDRRDGRTRLYRLAGHSTWGVEFLAAGYYLAVAVLVPEVRSPAALPALVVFGAGYLYLAVVTLASILSRFGAKHAA